MVNITGGPLLMLTSPVPEPAGDGLDPFFLEEPKHQQQQKNRVSDIQQTYRHQMKIAQSPKRRRE
jgi:hypothetical protein